MPVLETQKLHFWQSLWSKWTLDALMEYGRPTVENVCYPCHCPLGSASVLVTGRSSAALCSSWRMGQLFCVLIVAFKMHVLKFWTTIVGVSNESILVDLKRLFFFSHFCNSVNILLAPILRLHGLQWKLYELMLLCYNLLIYNTKITPQIIKFCYGKVVFNYMHSLEIFWDWVIGYFSNLNCFLVNVKTFYINFIIVLLLKLYIWNSDIKLSFWILMF